MTSITTFTNLARSRKNSLDFVNERFRPDTAEKCWKPFVSFTAGSEPTRRVSENQRVTTRLSG